MENIQAAILVERGGTFAEGGHCPQYVGEVESVVVGPDEEGNAERGDDAADD